MILKTDMTIKRYLTLFLLQLRTACVSQSQHLTEIDKTIYVNKQQKIIYQ